MPLAAGHDNVSRRCRVPWGACVLALGLLLGGCGVAPQSGPGTGNGLDSDDVTRAEDPDDDRSAVRRAARDTGVVRTARAMLGEPYAYGGEKPGGFDCSGLVHYAYHRAGVPVPRTVREQLGAVERLPRQRLRPGDLVFFRFRGKPAHVGIYVGGTRFIHAPSSGGVVRSDSLRQDYWRRRYLASGRFL